MLLRSKPKPRLRNADRILWVWMRQLGGRLALRRSAERVRYVRTATQHLARLPAGSQDSLRSPTAATGCHDKSLAHIACYCCSGELESGTGEGWARNSPSTAGPAEPMLPERSLREKCLRGRK